MRAFLCTCFWSIVRRSRMELVRLRRDQVIMWKAESHSHWSGPYFQRPGRQKWYFMPHFQPQTRWLSRTLRTCWTSWVYSGVNGGGAVREMAIMESTVSSLRKGFIGEYYYDAGIFIKTVWHQPKASSKMVIPHKGYTNWQYLFKTRALLNPTLSCPLICLPQSYLTVDITQNMYQEGERTPDDESSLTFRNKVNKGKLAYSSRRPITQKEPINKGNVAIGVGAVLIVAFLVYQLSVVGSRRAQSVKNDPCRETEEALQKQQEKVKTMMVAIDSLKSQLQASKRHVSQQQATLTPSVKSGTVAKPTATSSAVSGQQMKPGYVSKGAKEAPAHLQNPQIVIDIEYPEKDYLPLPVDFFRKNEQGKTLPEVLYADAEQRKKREDYQRQRITFMDGKNNYPQVFLTKYNMPLTEDAAKEGREANVKEWVRLNSKFGFDKVKTELPMCIMVPGYNNNANFRIEYNLNSIFSQNYTNYKVVVIDDKSSDGSGGVYRNYFAFHRIDKSRYTYIQNSKRVTALQNIYMGSLNHCPEDSIVVTIDADDEFIGRNVLQVFNWGYQTKKAGVLYTNFMWYQHRATLMYGFTSDYSQTVKKNNAFRSTPMQFSHLRSYRNQLIGQIDPKDLQDDKGEFFTITYDIALFIPLMELSCGRVYKIDGEYHYLYNTGTGLNDYNDRGRQVQVENKIRGRKRYECYQEFDKRMRK